MFPALFLLLFGGLQMALTSVIGNAVTAATHEAARCCELGADITETADAVDGILGVHGFGLGSGVRLVLQDDTGAVQSAGDASLTSDITLTPPPVGTCRALLIVEVSATPAPNMLTAFCVDFSDRRFECSSVATLEPDCP